MSPYEEKIRCVFVGGSYNGQEKYLPAHAAFYGFVDMDLYRNSDEFVDYIIEPNIEPEQRERYYITKIVLFCDEDRDVRTYAAIEHNRLMGFIKNQLPRVSNSDIFKYGEIHD